MRLIDADRLIIILEQQGELTTISVVNDVIKERSEFLISNAQQCLDELKDELLGKSWYIVDPVGGNQANEIVTNEIISMYKRVSLKQKLKEWLIKLSETLD